MTLADIKAVIAAYHEKAIADLTVNGVDLGLTAMNEAKRTAELFHDFGFQRAMLTCDVNTATGGNVESAVFQGGDGSPIIKTVLDIGTFDDEGNFCPVEWTTAEESQERQREENRFRGARYRYSTDAQYHSLLAGEGRVILRGDNIYFYPLCKAPGQDVSVGLDVYYFDDPWTADDLANDPINPWTTHASQYIQWQSICTLNKLFKSFVPRQEGNIGEPQALADASLQAFIDWDVMKYEQARRHGR